MAGRFLGVMLLAGALVCPGQEAFARPSGGKLVLHCPVKGATVVVDGKRQGVTPIKPLSLSAGGHKVLVRKLGYIEFAKKVTIQSDSKTEVAVDLLPFAGVIRIKANVRSTVAIDGEQIGKTPLVYEVALGRHTITVSAPGYRTHTEQIAADPGVDYKFRIRLKKAGGPVPADKPDGLPLEAPGKPKPQPAADADSDDLDDLDLEPLPELEMIPLPPAKAKTEEPTPEESKPAAAPVAPSVAPSVAVQPAAEVSAPAPSVEIIKASEAGNAGVSQPADFMQPPSVVATVDDESAWYGEWYVWAGAGAALVGGTLLVVLLSGDTEEGGTVVAADGSWQPGNPHDATPVTAIWWF